MNVLMITSDADVLRDGSAAQSLLKEQATMTNRLMVVVMNDHSSPSLPRKVTDSLWVFPTNSWAPFLKIINALYTVRHEIFFQNRLQADLIVANDPLGAGLAGYLIASIYKKPLHVHAENDIFSSSYARLSVFNLARSIIARIILGRAYTISVRHEKARAALVQADPIFTDRVTVIPHYIDIAAIQAEPTEEDLHVKYTQFRAIMLVVAPLVHDQNVQVAIQALAEVSKYYMHIGLVIVGDGPRKGYLKRYAKKLGVAESVIFEKARGNLIPYYKSAYLLMIPALYEEYENTIEEAAALGCAIISSPVGIAPDIIEDGKSGYLRNPRVPSEFWNAADALIRNTSVRADIKTNIVASIQAYMSKDKGEHLNLYKTSWEKAVKAARGV